MRDYLLGRDGIGGEMKPVADHTTSDLQEVLRLIMEGRSHSRLGQCTSSQMAERIRIELVARRIGA